MIGGRITEKFAKKNRVVSRIIQIRGDQTLQDLHEAIFAAFDREEEHMYEFQFGKGPMDPKGPRYVLPNAFEDSERRAQSTGWLCGHDHHRHPSACKAGDRFGDWFDFGDDWWHQINFEAVEDTCPRGKFPKVTKRVGKSPPRYLRRGRIELNLCRISAVRIVGDSRCQIPGSNSGAPDADAPSGILPWLRLGRARFDRRSKQERSHAITR